MGIGSTFENCCGSNGRELWEVDYRLSLNCCKGYTVLSVFHMGTITEII